MLLMRTFNGTLNVNRFLPPFLTFIDTTQFSRLSHFFFLKYSHLFGFIFTRNYLFATIHKNKTAKAKKNVDKTKSTPTLTHTHTQKKQIQNETKRQTKNYAEPKNKNEFISVFGTLIPNSLCNLSFSSLFVCLFLFVFIFYWEVFIGLPLRNGSMSLSLCIVFSSTIDLFIKT